MQESMSPIPSEQNSQAAIARREFAACIEKRGTYSAEMDRFGVTIGEIDWACELMRLTDEWPYT